MKVHIRSAKFEDLAFLLKLEKEAFPIFQQNSKQSIKKGIKSDFQEILVAEDTQDKKQAIGSMVLFKYKKSLRIYSIGLLTAYQNMGIGKILLNYAKKYAMRNEFEKLILEVNSKNSKLIDWYKTRGFGFLSHLKDYYGPGEDAIKMGMNVDKESKETKNVVVIDQLFEWENTKINATIISVKEYINDPLYQNNSDFRIFNLCSSYKYQSYGYYVSLLASARGQRVIPTITTVRDFRIINVIQTVALEVDELINNLLSSISTSTFSLNVFFEQTPNKTYKTLARKLYQIFQAPLFKVNFIKHERWLIKSIKVLAFKDIELEEKELMYEFAASYFNKKRHNYPKLTNYRYDLAVLVNPDEENPPSNKEALHKLKLAANKKGVYLEFITKADSNKINEFDALFIRETTNVNHHTYEISRLAYAEGLVVMDDPWSILRCSNKIYQNELFKKHKIRTPKTIALTKNMFSPKQIEEFNYPVVLKQPDSAFSLGVIKVNDKEEAKRELSKLFKISDMVICQEYLYSEFDWRVGILDNKPLFACKYYMSKGHWQIYDWKSNKEDKSGDSETMHIEDVPKNILKIAQKAASLIGDGLYGVDLKLVDGNVYVVEVNDNPNLDSGVEDVILKERLFEILIDSIINRIEIAKNIRKINFTSD